MKKNAFIRYSFSLALVLTVLLLGFISCNKNNPYTTITSPTMPEFIAASNIVTFGVGNSSPTTNYIIPIGLTTASGGATSVKVSISSPTGAAQGTQYTATSTDISIPAGKVTDSSLVLTANYATYQNGRIDTLVLTIQNSNTNFVLDSTKTTLKVVIRRACALAISDYAGDFVVVKDEWADYAPGDVITLTNVDATHFTFKNVHALNPTPISVTVNPTTNAVSIAKQTIGTLWNYNDPKYTTPNMSATGTIIPCDKIINFTVTYGYASSTFTGTYLLSLRKK